MTPRAAAKLGVLNARGGGVGSGGVGSGGALQRLGSILAKLKLPGPGPLALAQIQEAVALVFGGAAGRDLRVASYRKGKLTLEVKSAARAFEYQAFARSTAVAALRGKQGLEELTEIVFKNGSWSANGQR